MRSRRQDESDEILSRRGKRPTREQRPTGEEEEWDETDDEEAGTPRRQAPRDRRRKLEIDEDEPDSPPSPLVPWLPPARR